MSVKPFSLPVFILTTVLLVCEMPQDPSRDPGNASPSFRLVNGEKPLPPVKVTAGEEVTVTVHLYLEKFISGVSIAVETPEKGVDTQYSFSGPWDDTLTEFSFVFPEVGSKWCIIASRNSNGTSRGDTLIFTVVPQGSSPAWESDTLRLISISGIPDTSDLSQMSSDPDGDSLSYSSGIPGVHDGFVLSGSDLVLENYSDTGAFECRVVVSDGFLSDTAYVFWNVIPGPDLNDDTVRIRKDEPVTIDVLENDVAREKAAVASVTGGTLGEALIEENRVIYTPCPGCYGVDSLRYSVDGAEATVYVIIVSPVLVIRTDRCTIPENGTIDIAVLENDSISYGSMRLGAVDGQTLGSVQVHGDTVRFTADSGKAGVDTLVYRINDENDSGLILVTIVEIRFFIADDSASVVANGTRSIAVLDNDSVSWGFVELSSVKGGTRGSAVVDNGMVVYAADSGMTGPDTLIYFVDGGIDSGRVFLSILPITILARSDSFTIDEDAPATLLDVLANDSITSGQLSLTSVTGSLLGVSEIVDGKVVYTPGRDLNGADTLRYTVNDAAEGMLVVTVRPANDSPFARDTAVAVPEDSMISIPLPGSDIDGNPLKSAILRQAIHGRVTVQDDSSPVVSYRPDTDFCGSDSFLFVVRDLESESGPAMVRVAVRCRNDAPRVVINNGLTMDEGGSAPVTGSRFNSADADNPVTELSVTITGLPVNGELRKSGTAVDRGETFPLDNFISGTLAYAHDGSETSADSLSVSVSDGDRSVEATIRVTIMPVNDPPAFSKNVSSMKSACGLGNCFRDTVDVTDSEGNFAAMTMEVTPPSMKHTLSSSGKLVLDWCVDNRSHQIGEEVPIEITIRDGAERADLKWSVTVGRHVWTKVAEDVKSYGVFAAVDSFVMFNVDVPVTNIVLVKKKDLKISNQWIDFLTIPRGAGPGRIEQILVKNGHFYICQGEIRRYELSTGFFKDSTIPDSTYFSYTHIDDNGDSYGIGASGPYNSVFFKNGIEGFLGHSERNYFGIAVFNNLTFSLSREYDGNGVETGSYFDRWNQLCWNNSIQCQNMRTQLRSGAYGFYYDGNDGDTIYVTGYYDWICRIPNSNSNNIIIEDLSIASQKKPSMVAMIDGLTGFLVDSTGSLFFSNDGFATFIPEEIEPFVSAQYLFVSSDKKAFFILSKQDMNYCRSIYRY